MGGSELNNLVRIARLGKMYKLVKLTKLLRILKILKEKSKLLKYLNDILKVGLGFERLFFFILIFLMLIHIVGCLWVVIATLVSEEYIGTWMEGFAEDQLSSAEIYVKSLYWTITTITTVGYGDISGKNTMEELFSSLIMIVGVVSFSFANGSLASIL